MNAAKRNIDPMRPVRTEMSKILTEQPMIGSTVLFLAHRAHAEGRDDQIAATDGDEVHFWPRYFTMRLEHRLGVLLHEYLHVCFAHPLRGARLKRRLGAAYDHRILNVAADAIINAAIEAGTSGQIQLPKGGIVLKEIAAQAKAIVELTGVKIDVERMNHLGKLSVEWLYDALAALNEAAKCSQQQDMERCSGNAGGQGEPADGESACEASPDQANDNQPDGDGDCKQRQQRDAFIDQFARPGDLIARDLSRMGIEEIDEAIRQAGDKLAAAKSMHAHGALTRNVVEQMAGDLPKVSTRWESAFRSITQRHLAPQRMRQPTKPGRRVLSQEAMGLPDIIWSPGRRRPPVPLVVVVLDSSGSIQPQEYMRYLGEINAMKRRTNARIVAVVADTEVQSVKVIDDVREIVDIEFKGRGGTDFREPIALAEEMNADLVVYLTDLMGTFPEKPPTVPVLWTINASEVPSGYEPPFGRVLHLR